MEMLTNVKKLSRIMANDTNPNSTKNVYSVYSTEFKRITLKFRECLRGVVKWREKKTRKHKTEETKEKNTKFEFFGSNVSASDYE